MKGFFFLRRPRQKAEDAEERQKRLLTTVMGEFVKLLPQVRSAMNTPMQETNGDILGAMFDFYERWDQGGPVTATDIQWEKEEVIDDRIEATPVNVLNDLETIPIPIKLEALDEQIALFTKKTTMVSQRYSKEQIKGFIKRLENRKHYAENQVFFQQFPNTTDGRIEKLIDKYRLVIKPAELFIPTMPKDAIEVMEKYNKKCAKFTDETPVYYVIAEETDFKKKDEKGDPILLVQSPFGFYWQILGAWDKEMLLLSEL